MKLNKLTYLILALALVLSALFAKLLPADKPTTAAADGLVLTFVDVGQGDAIFLKTQSGETWLIDGGDDSEYNTRLLPFLESQGIAKIDYAVVTHYHNDHAGGIFQLLKAGKIKTLLLPNYTPSNKAKNGLLKNAEIQHTPVLDISAGDILKTSDPDLRLTVLHPEKGGFSTENENSNSLLIRLDFHKTSALLTGDLEEDAESGLLAKHDLEVDILKVGHHGSTTSTSPGFLAEVNPTYGIISAGKGNRYGHPHFETLARLENDDVRVYRTDLDGDITFILNENGIKSITTGKE